MQSKTKSQKLFDSALLIGKNKQPSWLKTICFTVLSASGGAVMEAYTSFLTQNIGPLCLSLVAWTQDHITPMPIDQQIVAKLTFYLPSKVTKDHSQEGMGVMLSGKECRQPGGAQGVQTYEFGDSETFTDALVLASCRPSGKTRVTITPGNGSPIVIFDGFFNNEDKFIFGGVPGSYEHGVLTMLYVGTNQPSGPMVPLNQQQPE